MESTQIVNRQIKEVSQFSRDISGSSHKIFTEIGQVAAIIKETTAKTEAVAIGSSAQMDSMQEINVLAEELQAVAQALQASARKFKLV